MNIFDNIAKNVRKATVPAVESLTENEIDGLAMAATTNEDYDTIGAAMEAIGVETVYKEEKVKKEELTEKEIRQLYEAGMEDEDPDDYEDPLAEEAIIDGYIEEAYAAEADDALGALSEEDLEDIEDDDATESYLLLAGSEDIAEEGLVDDVKKAVKDNIAEKKARNQALKDDAKTVTSSKKDVKKELEKSKALSAKDVIATTARITALIAALKAAQKSGTPIDQIDKAAKDELDWFNGIKGEWYDKLSINGDKNDTLYKCMSDIRRFKKQYEECESIIKNYSNTNYPIPTNIFNKAKELAKNEDIYVAKDFVEAWARKRGMSNPEQYAYNILKNLGGSQYATAKFTPPGVSKELFKEVVLQIPERVNSAYKACGLTVATILSGRIKAGVGFKVKDFLTAKTAKLELENAARKSLAQVKNLQKKGQDASKVIEATEDIISQLNKLGSVLEKEKNLDYAHSKYGQIIRQAKDTAETLTADLTKLKKTPVAESFSNYPSRS